MEKTVPNKHSRRHSTGNLILELTGYEDVLSRYLSAPFRSCHDNCKPDPPRFDHPTEHKSTHIVKKSNKTHVDSVHGIKKPFTPIPKSPTKHFKITNTSVLKHQVKSQHIESKRQDFKSKSTIKSKSVETDPFYIPPSRITRRFSDIIIPANGLGDVLDSTAVGGLTRSSKKNDKKLKTDSRKDLNPVKSIVKTPGNGTVSNKVQTLKTQNNLTKPVDHGATKSKPANPVGEVVQEKTQKSQRVLENSQNEAQIASKSKKDETPQSESQNNGSVTASGIKKAENPTRVQTLAKENDDRLSQKLKFKQGKIIDMQSESSGSRKLKFGEGKVLDENQNDEEHSKSLRRLSSDGVLHAPENNSVNIVLRTCDMEANKCHMHLNNVIEETASKLIQTRKSKVKALVGAFEMISANGV